MSKSNTKVSIAKIRKVLSKLIQKERKKENQNVLNYLSEADVNLAAAAYNYSD